MATKKQAEELAKKVDATITDSGTTIELEAPAGYLVAPEQHAYSYDVLDGRSGVWKAIIEDLNQGFDLCTSTDCDWCNS
jgi:hypothetical protein